MADHPAIVALAKEQYWLDWLHGKWRAPCLDELDAVWGCAPPTIKQGYLRHARAAYAAVLKDLMEPSEEMWRAAAKEIPGYDYPFVYKGLKEAIKARAREIGVEIEP